MMKKRLAIAGCGKLAGIIASAYNKGLLPDYTFVGTWSRSFDSAKNIAGDRKSTRLNSSH